MICPALGPIIVGCTIDSGIEASVLSTAGQAIDLAYMRQTNAETVNAHDRES